MYRAHLQSQGIMDKYPLGAGSNRLVKACTGGLYDAYIRQDFLSIRDDEDLSGLFRRGKIWHGSPTAALLHAAKVLTRPSPNPNKPWLDSKKLRQLRDLITLWSRPDPQVFNPPLDVPSGDDHTHTENDDNSDKGDDLDKHKLNPSTVDAEKQTNGSTDDFNPRLGSQQQGPADTGGNHLEE